MLRVEGGFPLSVTLGDLSVRSQKKQWRGNTPKLVIGLFDLFLCQMFPR